MTSVSYREEINSVLERLPEANLKALLRVLRNLPPDRPLRRWSIAAGSLSPQDAEEMRQAVEEGCEQVDPDSW